MGQGDRIDHVRSRFADAPWLKYFKHKPVTVIGSGGIGSWVTMCLTRIGATVYLYDSDLVETHNLGGQMLRARAIGSYKVHEVENLCRELSGNDAVVMAMDEMFEEDSAVTEIVILAVDNMAARKLAFEKWLDDKQNGFDPINMLLIDGRLLAEDYQVYVVTPATAERYRATLFSDSEVEKENCSLKATTHCSLGIASEIIGCLTNWTANRQSQLDGTPLVRDVPFSIVKSIPNYLYDLTFDNGNQGSKEEEGAYKRAVLPTPAELPF